MLVIQECCCCAQLSRVADDRSKIRIQQRHARNSPGRTALVRRQSQGRIDIQGQVQGQGQSQGRVYRGRWRRQSATREGRYN